MTFAIITHTPHHESSDDLSAYAPYVKEMNYWMAHFSESLLVAPKIQEVKGSLFSTYEYPVKKYYVIPAIALVSPLQVVKALFAVPFIVIQVFRAMRNADHIHLRCPGNIGLIGCLVQVLFPGKPKTAKYAGNWDPGAKQPRSYRVQKWILRNTFLTRNMKVLVYGDWKQKSKNIVPFFTASYSSEKAHIAFEKSFEPPFAFVFAGNLSKGKRPEYAVKLIDEIRKRGVECTLDIFGDGPQKIVVESEITERKLHSVVKLHGNVHGEELEAAYRNSHFLILPSKSEGWPKVVAEAMFWGCVPVVTAISCVPWMLGEGERGILIDLSGNDTDRVISLLQGNSLEEMARKAQVWSRQYTLDSFSEGIKKVLS